MNILHLDTSSNKEIKVGLEINGKINVINKITDTWKSQILLPLIVEILTKHNLALNDIDEIKVELGPGSFTGLRVGVAVANTLGKWLKIPVNGNPVGVIVEPRYT